MAAKSKLQHLIDRSLEVDAPPAYSSADPVKLTGEPLSEPIFWTGRQWAVTSYGVEARDGTYPVAKDRLWEDNEGYGWVDHLSEKDWVDLPDFVEALRLARQRQLRPDVEHQPLESPGNWRGKTKFRLFISHVSAEKEKAERLRECLAPYHISGFVAHQDIHPTLEWQTEIERALQAMDAFLAVHTKGFSSSYWAQQEVGFAIARGVKIISFKLGEDPVGFISKHQALTRLNRSAEEIAGEVHKLLRSDPRTSQRLQFVELVNRTSA